MFAIAVFFSLANLPLLSGARFPSSAYAGGSPGGAIRGNAIAAARADQHPHLKQPIKEVMKIERVGHDEISRRDLYVLEVEVPADVPSHFDIPHPRHVCLLAWDSRQATVDQIAHLAARLLKAGAVYVCAWGPGCARVHDIIDEVSVGPNPQGETASVIMTTFHDNESLAEAIWFSLFCAFPDDPLAEGCDATVGIAIGSSEWAADLRAAFSDPAAFVREHLD